MHQYNLPSQSANGQGNHDAQIDEYLCTCMALSIHPLPHHFQISSRPLKKRKPLNHRGQQARTISLTNPKKGAERKDKHQVFSFHIFKLMKNSGFRKILNCRHTWS
jgi:hypothetical protein